MSTRIVLCYPVEAKHLQRIAAAMPEVQVVDAGQERCGSRPSIRRACQGAGLLGRRGAPGTAAVDSVLCGRNGPLPGAFGGRVGYRCLQRRVGRYWRTKAAEHAIALITGWCRGLPVLAPSSRGSLFATCDLMRSTVGIVGLGVDGGWRPCSAPFSPPNDRVKSYELRAKSHDRRSYELRAKS